MSLFNRKENRDAALGNLVDLLALREGGLTNNTGEKVNEMSALGISTVFSAISDNLFAFSSDDEELLKIIFASSITSEIKLSGFEL